MLDPLGEKIIFLKFLISKLKVFNIPLVLSHIFNVPPIEEEPINFPSGENYIL